VPELVDDRLANQLRRKRELDASHCHGMLPTRKTQSSNVGGRPFVHPAARHGEPLKTSTGRLHWLTFCALRFAIYATAASRSRSAVWNVSLVGAIRSGRIM